MSCTVASASSERSSTNNPFGFVINAAQRSSHFVVSRLSRYKNHESESTNDAKKFRSSIDSKETLACTSTSVDSVDILQLIAEDVESSGGCKSLCNLESARVQEALRLMQELLDDGPAWNSFSLPPSQSRREQIRESLFKLSDSTSVYPPSFFVNAQHDPRLIPERGGIYSRVYCAQLLDQQVALIRLSCTGPPRTSWSQTNIQKLYRNCLRWRQLRHPNLVPFLGVDIDTYHGYPAFVFPWFNAGNIREYIRNLDPAPNNNQRIKWLNGIARGVNYLHENAIAHGDLRGDNILMTDDGTPQISDLFFYEFRTSDLEPRYETGSGPERYTAPEYRETGEPSPESDVYSLGWVAIEVYTANPPYAGRPDRIAIHKMLINEFPPRPEVMHETVWSSVNSCWRTNPADRPKVEEIITILDTSLRDELQSQD